MHHNRRGGLVLVVAQRPRVRLLKQHHPVPARSGALVQERGLGNVAPDLDQAVWIAHRDRERAGEIDRHVRRAERGAALGDND